VRLLSSLGTVPLSFEEFRNSYCSCQRFPNSIGIVPESSLDFFFNSGSPSSLGTVPFNFADVNQSDGSQGNSLNSEGIHPETLLDCNLKF